VHAGVSGCLGGKAASKDSSFQYMYRWLRPKKKKNKQKKNLLCPCPTKFPIRQSKQSQNCWQTTMGVSDRGQLPVMAWDLSGGEKKGGMVVVVWIFQLYRSEVEKGTEIRKGRCPFSKSLPTSPTQRVWCFL